MHRFLLTTSCRCLLGLTVAAAGMGAAGAETTTGILAAPKIAPPQPTLNFYLVPGLIDMPSGEAQADGDFSTGISYFGGIARTAITFQIAPMLSGSFRYSGIKDLDYAGWNDYYDRSFDLRLRVLKETQWLPSVTVGLQDFVGTGVSSAEYIAATKNFPYGIKATAGVGWGRFGSSNSFGSPLGERPPTDVGMGGMPNYGQWFRGPAAPFAGIEWQVNDKLGLKAEYSSDAYTLESEDRDVLDRKSDFNFGVEYQVAEGVRLGAYSMYGSTVGVSATFVMNPRRAVTPLSFPAPPPIDVRTGAASSWSTEWVNQPGKKAQLDQSMTALLAHEGLELESLVVTGTSASLRYRDTYYDSRPNGIGRAARVMANVLPPSVESFQIIPVWNGQALMAVTVRRSDLERLEFSPTADRDLWARTTITDAGNLPVPPPAAGAYPQNFWSIEPYLRASYFDPKKPYRAEVGLRALAQVSFAPGLVLGGSVRVPIAGNLDEPQPASNSQLPHVRTDTPLYDKYGQPGLESLTLAQYFRPGKALYGSVAGGYLEPQFAGLSTALLWKPVDSRLAFGADLSYAVQRDYDMQFGLQDYSVVTGYLSGYYDFGGGFIGNIDVGRYLAGDYGATIAVERQFNNGWRVGAFATKTNVSAEEFGEGSFDKGIYFTVPMAWFTGRPNQTGFSATFRPVLRDGGAQLFNTGALYDRVRAQDVLNYEEQWGRFWR